MSHPLIGTDWIHKKAGPPIKIDSEQTYKTEWENLRDNYEPAQDYLFKYGGNSSTYKLTGIKDEDEGLFENISKGNSKRELNINHCVQVGSGSKTATKASAAPQVIAQPKAQKTKVDPWTKPVNPNCIDCNQSEDLDGNKLELDTDDRCPDCASIKRQRASLKAMQIDPRHINRDLLRS